MWESWEKTKITDAERIYSYLVDLKDREPKIVIELTAMLLQSDTAPNWEVLITAFHPSSGEHTIFEEEFPSFEEAEKIAWEQSQKAVNIRKS